MIKQSIILVQTFLKGRIVYTNYEVLWTLSGGPWLLLARYHSFTWPQSLCSHNAKRHALHI